MSTNNSTPFHKIYGTLKSTASKAGYEVLNYIHPHPAGDGAYYIADMNGSEHKLWLCGVTEFVFRYMPEEVWYRKQNSNSGAFIR